MYFKDLSKKEKKHLREQGCPTLREFKWMVQKQAEMRRWASNRSEPCWDCRAIAQKLGLPV